MAIEKRLNTRIALKYDTYANWIRTDIENKGANFVLLPGEVGICEIPATKTIDGLAIAVQTTEPTILFKVGDGTKKFSELPWTSAKAADVASWAKSSDVALNNGVLQFITGDTVNKEIDFTDHFAPKIDVSKLTVRVAALEASGGGNSSVSSELAEQIATNTAAITTLTSSVNSNTSNVNALTATVGDLQTRTGKLETKVAGLTELTGLSARVQAVEEDIKSLQELTKDGGDLIQQITEAKQIGTDAQTAVTNLTASVNKLTVDIAVINEREEAYLKDTDTFIFECVALSTEN